MKWENSVEELILHQTRGKSFCSGFMNLLSACSHAGYLEEGKSFFNRMTRSLGIQPNCDHFGCLVDILCRAGDLNGAQEINASTHATTSTCQHLEFPCKWLQNPPTDGCCWKHHRKSCKHMDVTLCCLTCMQKKKVKGEVYRRSRVRV